LIAGDSASSKTLALQLLIALGCGNSDCCATTVLLFGFGPAIMAFCHKILARNTSTGSVVGLIQGYGLSYGLFILTIISNIALAYFDKRQNTKDNRQQTHSSYSLQHAYHCLRTY